MLSKQNKKLTQTVDLLAILLTFYAQEQRQTDIKKKQKTKEKRQKTKNSARNAETSPYRTVKKCTSNGVRPLGSPFQETLKSKN